VTTLFYSTSDLPCLKVPMPKCEIFYYLDFHDFHHQSIRDFGVKLKIKKIFRGSFGAEKFLTHMISIHISD
jgi:hypothetical protein